VATAAVAVAKLNKIKKTRRENMKRNFSITGMHCNSCAQLIEIALEELGGVKSAKVDFKAGRAAIEFDEGKLTPLKIEETIEKAGTGYKAKIEGGKQ
jgi:Cu+-exporting ATPase